MQTGSHAGRLDHRYRRSARAARQADHARLAARRIRDDRARRAHRVSTSLATYVTQFVTTLRRPRRRSCSRSKARTWHIAGYNAAARTALAPSRAASPARTRPGEQGRGRRRQTRDLTRGGRDCHARPQPDEVLGRYRRLRHGYTITSREAYETARLCLIDTLGCGLEALSLSRLHQAARAHRAGNGRAPRREGAGHAVSARSGAGGVQHRRHDPLARLQRHLARRRMGPSLGQSGRHSRHGRLAVAHGGRAAGKRR